MKCAALFVLLTGCGGVAGAELFAPSPLTPPGLCPDSEGCGYEPAESLTLVAAPSDGCEHLADAGTGGSAP